MSTSVYKRGAGFDQSLVGATPAEVTMLTELQENISAVIVNLDDIVTDTSSIIQDIIIPFTGIDLSTCPEKYQINGEWIIKSSEDFSLSNLITLFRVSELSQLTDFPYILSAGDNSNLTGQPLEAWESGESDYYNEETGLAVEIEDIKGNWFVTFSKIQTLEIKTKVNRDQVENTYEVITTKRIRNSFDLVNMDDLSLVRKRSLIELEKFDSKIRCSAQKVAATDFATLKQWEDTVGPLVSESLPDEKMAQAYGSLNNITTAKQDLINLLAVSISDEEAEDLYIGDGKVAETTFSTKRSGSRTEPFEHLLSSLDIVKTLQLSIIDCGFFKWLANQITSFIAAVINMINDILNQLEKIFSLDFLDRLLDQLGSVLFDVCGTGFRIPISTLLKEIIEDAVDPNATTVDPVTGLPKSLQTSLVRFSGISALEEAQSSVETSLDSAESAATNFKNRVWTPGKT